MPPPVLIFLASGTDKAAILREILENRTADLPSQRVQPTNGKLIWLVDEPAAGALSRRSAECLLHLDRDHPSHSSPGFAVVECDFLFAP